MRLCPITSPLGRVKVGFSCCSGLKWLTKTNFVMENGELGNPFTCVHNAGQGCFTRIPQAGAKPVNFVLRMNA